MEFAEFAQGIRFTEGQRRSAQYLEGPLLISAGAGSGKTFTLTKRVAWALTPGSAGKDKAFLKGIDELLVITFTEKAAAEIKDRIRSTLRAAGKTEMALQVDAAWVSTIHGMCARILREHALEIGVDPAFEVIGEARVKELRAMAIDEVLAAMEGNSTSPYWPLFNTFEMKVISESLEDLLRTAASMPAGLAAVELGPEDPGLAPLLRQLLELAETPPENSSETERAAHAALAQAIQSYIEEGQGAGEYDRLDELTAIAYANARPFSKGVELKEVLYSLRDALRVLPYCEHGKLLLQLAREIEETYQQYMAQAGQLDISGLIRRTLATFRDFPEIAAQYTDRFKLVMVDEFQDTSQLQIDMIECIVGANKQSLCTVGDAQQSIYRFQGADVDVYMQHKQDMRACGAEVVELDTNFRSHEDILAFVRRVCGQEAYFAEDFLDLKPGPGTQDYKGTGPRIEVALADYSPEGANAESARLAAAAHIAQRFAELRDMGGPGKGHKPGEMVLLLGGMTNAVLYAQALREKGFDCVIAGGSKYFEEDHVLSCLDVLDALANPYDAIRLLTVLTSPILRVTTEDLLYLSTKWNSENERFVRRSLTEPFLQKNAAPAEASPLLTHAMAVFERAWKKLGTVRPAKIFTDFVLESGWLARLEAGGVEDQAVAADVLKFIRLVEEAQSTLGFDMARTAREMRLMSKASKEKPGALSSEDAVRIMTVHSSKGLEFPIVAVAECYEISSKHNSGHVALLPSGNTLQMSFASDGSSSYAGPAFSFDPAVEPVGFRRGIYKANTEKEWAEKRRLFYVAATRASAALIVSITTRPGKEGYKYVVDDILNGLWPDEAAFPAASRELDYGGTEPLLFTRLETIAPENEAAEEINLEEGIQAYPALADNPALSLETLRVRADFFSYSSLAHEGEGSEDVEGPVGNVEAEGPVGNKGSSELSVQQSGSQPQLAGERYASALIESEEGGMPVPLAPAADLDKATDFGSALHRACEWLALQSSEPAAAEVSEALERAAAEFGVQDAARLRAAFERWQGSEARVWANAFETQQPELPFTAAIDGRFLEGEIDLFCTTGKKAGIIDYKTGGSPSETPEQLQAKHLLQAQCYAFAALQVGYESVELRFVRVEQQDPASPAQPQVVCYEFTSADLQALHDAIVAAG